MLKTKKALQAHQLMLMFNTDFNKKIDNNVTFVFSQSPPVKAALLFPDAAAFGVDLILGSASAAHLVQCCRGTGECAEVRPTTGKQHRAGHST